MVIRLFYRLKFPSTVYETVLPQYTTENGSFLMIVRSVILYALDGLYTVPFRSTWVSKVSSGFEFFLLIFPYGSVLALYLAVLGAEFNSASNGELSDTSCSVGSRCFTPNTGSKAGFTRYLLLTFAHEPVLAFLLVVLGAEFDSASNGTTLERRC